VPTRPTRPGKHAARHSTKSLFPRPDRPSARRSLRRLGATTIALAAVVTAGAAGDGVGAGTPSNGRDPSSVALDLPSTDPQSDLVAEREGRGAEVSRSAVRTSLAEQRDHVGGFDADRTGAHTARAQSTVPEDPRDIARQMLAEYGWEQYEFGCLDELWISESDWEFDATNPTSGAYGIPQALPAGKMSTAGSDWRTNPATQIEWGLWYIDNSYGTPCAAWEFKQANNWY
jgi:hypothetical protein